MNHRTTLKLGDVLISKKSECMLMLVWKSKKEHLWLDMETGETFLAPGGDWFNADTWRLFVESE